MASARGESHPVCDTAGQGSTIEGNKPIEAIDATKLNALLDFVRERLTSDVFGNFNLQGDRLARDGRHQQRREICELNRLLEDTKTIMERKDSVAPGGEDHEARRTSKPNVTQVAVVRDIVKDELEKELRDLRIENERLRDDLGKAEERTKKAEKDHAALRENVRKISSGQLKGVRSTVKEEVGRSVKETFEQAKIKERLADSEKSIKQAATEMEAQMRAVEMTLVKRVSEGTELVKRHTSVQISEAKELTELEVEKLRQDYENDMDKLSTELLKWRTEHNEKLHSCNLWADDVLDRCAIIQEIKAESDTDRIAAIQSPRRIVVVPQRRPARDQRPNRSLRTPSSQRCSANGRSDDAVGSWRSLGEMVESGERYVKACGSTCPRYLFA